MGPTFTDVFYLYVLSAIDIVTVKNGYNSRLYRSVKMCYPKHSVGDGNKVIIYDFPMQECQKKTILP
jgi:hypothetical protein